MAKAIVIGIGSVAKKLQGASQDIKQAAWKENLKTGFRIHRRAVAQAPVDTGFMRANIGVYARAHNEEVAVAGGMVSQATELQGFDHAGGGPLDVDYFEHVHEGTSRMAGRPFLASAAAASEAGHKMQSGKAVAGAIRKQHNPSV